MDTTAAAQWPPQVKAMEDILRCPKERKMRPHKEQALNCPRCNSGNTKFCYYNNYNLSQPRYFCKTCRRYWTEGGSLRNIPVGGGSRKHRPSSSKNPNKILDSPCFHANPSSSSLDLLTSKGVASFIPPPSPSPPPFPMPDFKPSLSFSLEGVGSGYGSFQGVPEANGKLLFPFEDLNNNAHQNRDHNSIANAYWNGVLGGGGSW